jgi:pimeloyl-ACP methyl ester carboxylesterase
MSASPLLGEQRAIDLPTGKLAYRERGAGPPIVFVHGVGVNGDLWRRVVPRLAGEHRCVVPDLPLGSHSHPVREDADLSLPGIARIVASLLEALGLHDVAIVANDTGGAVAQWLVGHHAERIGRLVLTSCDAFEKFPPTPQRYLTLASRSPAAMWLVARAVQLGAVQRSPLAYGWATRRPIEPRIMQSFTKPVARHAGVRRDLTRLLRAVDTRYTYEAADALRSFERPSLVLWAADDKLFPHEHGRLLAERLPAGSYEEIADSRTFIPEDQPERLAERTARFLAGAR